MNQKNWTDDQLIDALRSDDTKLRDAAFAYLYKDDYLRATIKKYVYYWKGNEIDFKDIFADVLVWFDLNIHSFDPSKSALRTAIIGKARKDAYTLWRSRQRGRKKHLELMKVQTDSGPVYEDGTQSISQLLAQAFPYDERCRQLMQLQAEGFSMKEIAAQMGYRSGDSAKSANTECKKKLTQYYKDHPEKRSDHLDT